MAEPSEEAVVAELLRRYPQTFAEEAGLTLRDKPSPLFRLLCMSLLMSARISSRIASKATRALAEQGWTTADKMSQSTWEQRTRTLNSAGYARYDESTATMLGDTTQMVLDDYRGDLRRLREAANRAPDAQRRLLKRFKGIGDTGADIFMREVQATWDEVFPFVDERAAASAAHLGLGENAAGLCQLTGRADFPRLVAALVRVDLDHDHDAVIEAAR